MFSCWSFLPNALSMCSRIRATNDKLQWLLQKTVDFLNQSFLIFPLIIAHCVVFFFHSFITITIKNVSVIASDIEKLAADQYFCPAKQGRFKNAEIICLKAVESSWGAGTGVSRVREMFTHLGSWQELRIWGQRNQKICSWDMGGPPTHSWIPLQDISWTGGIWGLEAKKQKEKASENHLSFQQPRKRKIGVRDLPRWGARWRHQALRPRVHHYPASHQTKN